MSLSELKELLGVLPPTPLTRTGSKHKLFSFLSDSQYRSEDDSIVNQSFIHDFNSHSISEPLSVQQSSPLSSSGEVNPLPFINGSSVSPISSVSLCSTNDSVSCTNSSGTHCNYNTCTCTCTCMLFKLSKTCTYMYMAKTNCNIQYMEKI